MARTTRNRSANPILSMMRDDDLKGDPWGTAIAWAFSGCDVLCDADPNMVPAGLQYSPGMGGPEVPTSSEDEVHRITLADLSHETVAIWCWLHNVAEDDPAASDPDALLYWGDPTFNARAEELRTALLCLDRYLDWCKAAGRDY